MDNIPVIHIKGPDQAFEADELSMQPVSVSVHTVLASTSTLASTFATALPPPTENGAPELTQEDAHTLPEEDVEQARPKMPWFVLPLNAVLGTASIGLFAFLNSIPGTGAQTVSICG